MSENEQSTDSSANQPQKSAGKKAVGNFISKIEEVPKEVRDYAINKLSPLDADGNRVKDDNGKVISASISTAKENGSYYGPVVLNNEKFLVQAVGKDRLYAIVHEKENIALQGSSLNDLDAKKTMNGTNLQIHYTGDKAKAYHWAGKDKQVNAGRESLAKEAPKPEDLMQQAAEYAQANIKNANQREAFLKHMGNVTEQAFSKQQPSPAKVKGKSEPTQDKQADAGIER